MNGYARMYNKKFKVKIVSIKKNFLSVDLTKNKNRPLQ